jgi:hypothetical protein
MLNVKRTGPNFLFVIQTYTVTADKRNVGRLPSVHFLVRSPSWLLTWVPVTKPKVIARLKLSFRHRIQGPKPLALS